MAICVKIEIDDEGAVTVGIESSEDDKSDGKDYMQSAENLDVALAKAKAFLSAEPDDKPKNMQEAMFGKNKPAPKKA